MYNAAKLVQNFNTTRSCSFWNNKGKEPQKLIKFKKRKTMLFRKEKDESYENAKTCYICNKKMENKYLKDKKYYTARDHCYYTGK